jgi:hypothetical protein
MSTIENQEYNMDLFGSCDLANLNSQLRFSVIQFLDFIKNKQHLTCDDMCPHRIKLLDILDKMDKKETNARCDNYQRLTFRK